MGNAERKISIIINPDKLEELKQNSFYKTFSRFDEEGKIEYLGDIFVSYYSGKDAKKHIEKWSGDEKKEFCELLYEAVGLSGVWAMLSTVEGSGTYSWSRGHGVEDIIAETEKIINDKEYRSHVDTALAEDIEILGEEGMFYRLRKDDES